MNGHHHKTTGSEEEIQKLSVEPVIANEYVSGEIASWEGIRVREHRNGRVAFWINKTCLGYLHNPPGDTASARLKFHRTTLDEPDRTETSRSQTEDKKESSGWITVSMDTVAGVTRAINLFQHRYKQVLETMPNRSSGSVC